MLAFRDAYGVVILTIGVLVPFVWMLRGRAFAPEKLGGGAAARQPR